MEGAVQFRYIIQKENMNRYIAHFDMDAFFAAVEERNNPRFAGLPIAVGADPKDGRGRGVVSTANYAARVYGIGSGQPITRAWKLSQAAELAGKPAVVFLPGSWRIYEKISNSIMEIIREAAPIMQQRSVDEAYADLSAASSLAAAEAMAREIKSSIYAAERLTVSVGLGPNKLVAKIASDFKKPNGFTVVDASYVKDFLSPLPVRAIPGVGPKTEIQLAKLKIKTIHDLQQFSLQGLENHFGKWGEALYRKAQGIDNSEIIEEYDRKSIGEQRTFAEDIADPAFVIDRMVIICRDVFKNLLGEGYVGARTISITVRYSDFSTISSAHTAKKMLVQARQIEQEAIRLVLPFLDTRRNPQKKPIRLVGVRLEKLQ